MKICIISNLYGDDAIGGAEIAAQRLAQRLNEDNKVIVITTGPLKGLSSLWPASKTIDDVKTYRFYPLNLYRVYSTEKRNFPLLIKALWHIIDLWNLHSFWVILNILKKEKPDIIYTYNIEGLSLSVLWAARSLKIFTAYTLHSYNLLCPYAIFICPLTNFTVCQKRTFPCKIISFLKKIIINRLPSIVVGPSKFVIDLHQRYGFFKKTKCKIIPNFVESQTASLHVVKNGSKETFDILYVGRLAKEKGIDVLLDAFSNIKEDSLNLHIAGDGPKKREIEKMAVKNSRINYYGKISYQELKNIYAFCDVLVVPSIWYEVLPNVIIEGLSFGLPVITSRIGEMKNIIKNDYNGYLVEPGNSQELKAKLVLLAKHYKNNYKLFDNFTKNALCSAEAFNEGITISGLKDIYLALNNTKPND